MLEDTILSELRLRSIDPQKVLSKENDETAYSLETICLGECQTQKQEEELLSRVQISDVTLGFESETDCDLLPCDLITYSSDKTVNAEYHWGNHAPGEREYQTECRFKPGEKVLCLIYEGYDAVFPGIVVGPLTEEYIRQLYEVDEDMQIGYSSADEAVEKWYDWNWDSVIVRPLVRLKNDWEEMGDTVIVNRVYVFPYKTYKV